MNRTLLLGAAVAGLLGAATTAKADPIPKDKLKKMAVVPCYGVNTCKSLGQCSGETPAAQRRTSAADRAGSRSPKRRAPPSAR